MVTASAGCGLVVLSESWANPTSHTLPLVPGTFIPSKKDQIVTLGVYAKTQLVKYGKLNVKTLSEIAAACL